MSRFIAFAAFLLIVSGVTFGLPRSEAAYVKVTGNTCDDGTTTCPNLIEGFDNTTFPFDPESIYYTFTKVGSTGSVGIATDVPESGANYYKLATTASQLSVISFELGTNLCLGNGPGNSRTVDFSLKNVVGEDSTHFVSLRTVAGTDFARFSVNRNTESGGLTGSITFDNTATSATSPTNFFGDSDASWRRFGISCSNLGATFIAYDTSFSQTLTVGSGTFTPTRLEISVQGGGGTIRIDRINFGSPPAIVQTTPAGPVVTVSNLVGMDVDSSGTTLIARTHDAAGNTQDNIRVYGAQGLSSAGTAENSECNRLRGIAAMKNTVAFLECNDGDEDDVDFLKLRASNLGPPDMPGYCSGFCTGDINANELAGCQGVSNDEDAGDEDCDSTTGTYEIVGVQELPFDFNDAPATGDFGPTPDLLGGHLHMAFGMSFQDGTIGVATYSFNDNLDDKSQIQRISVGPVQTIAKQICTIQDTNGDSYLYAAGADQAKGFSVTFSNYNEIGEAEVSVDLVEVFSGSAITASPLGVACAEGRFAVITSTTLSVWNRGANTPLWQRTVASVPNAGIAMNAEFVAWVEATTLRVACIDESGCAANDFRDEVEPGSAVLTGTLPTGTFVQMDMDGQAQIVWIGTDVRIQAYNQVYKLTTGVATACNPGDIGCGPGGTTTNTGTAGPGSGGVLGFGVTGNIIASVATVTGFLLLAYAMTSRRKTGPPEE